MKLGKKQLIYSVVVAFAFFTVYLIIYAFYHRDKDELVYLIFNSYALIAVLLSFLLNALVCTTIDFTTGMVANQDYSLWDYRDLPFNFMGQVCLQNSMVYSIAATFIVWVVYPLMDSVLHRAPRGVVNAIAVGLFGMYLFLAMLYFIDISAFLK